MMAEGGSENQTLKDNWDDAEGYYREWCIYCIVCLCVWVGLLCDTLKLDM